LFSREREKHRERVRHGERENERETAYDEREARERKNETVQSRGLGGL
jgi:hypothetical protein